MSFLSYFWKGDEKRSDEVVTQEATQVNTESIFGGTLLYNSSTTYNQNQAMLLSAVYRCVDLLSNSISEMPVVVYKTNKRGNKKLITDHISYRLLNKKPNNRMNKHTFWKLIVMNMLLTGNGYAWIKRDENGQANELIFLPSDQVSVVSNNIFDDVKYLITGVKKYVTPKDMLHFINIPDHDGIRGVSTLQYARKTLTLGMDELASANSFFRSGNNKSGFLKSEKPLTDAQTQQIVSNWQQTFGTSQGINTSGVVVLKPGLDFTSIQTDPADAELLDSRKFNVAEIARFFGVPLSLLFDNSTNSYSSQEAENLNFLIHGLTPLLDRIEAELNDKIWNEPEEMQGYGCKFDSSVILRADKKSLAEYYTKLFNLGVLSPNEIRKELDLDAIDGGENHFMQVNISTLDKIANQPIEQNPTLSNQLKGEDNTDNQEEGGKND